MTMNLRQLIEARATAWAAVQDIQDRRGRAGYESTQEDGETYTRALDDVERLSQDIEREERAARLAVAVNAPVGDQRSTAPAGAHEDNGSEAAYRAVFDTFIRRGAGALSEEQRQVLTAGYREERAAGVATGAAGGYLVPTEFQARLIEVMKAFGGIGDLAENITTSTGDPIQWGTNDDTANVGAILGENTQITEQDLTFGTGTLGAYMYTSKLVRASLQFIQDAAVNIDAWLPQKLGERIGRAQAAHFATGTGTGQPQGIVTGLTLGLTSAQSGTIGYDDLVDLEHAIDPAYRTDAAGYVAHDSVIKVLRKVKDSTGRPLWAPAISVGAPSTINGHPYKIDNGLATLAAGSKSLVYGDIAQAYVVRRVAGSQVMRLTERYADFLQVGFLAFARADAKVQDTQAAAVLTTKV